MELTKMLQMVRLTEDELISGFLSVKKGTYYIVINRKDENGNRKPLWKATGLPATDEYKEDAESKCLSARIQYSVDLKNGIAEQPKERKKAKSSKSVSKSSSEGRNPLFADVLMNGLNFAILTIS